MYIERTLHILPTVSTEQEVRISSKEVISVGLECKLAMKRHQTIHVA